MENNAHKFWVLYVIVALLFGLGVGYWKGTVIGREQGREALIAEQNVAEEEAKRKAQEEITKAANPFETQNPLEDAYQNPFKAKVNPFAQ